MGYSGGASDVGPPKVLPRAPTSCYKTQFKQYFTFLSQLFLLFEELSLKKWKKEKKKGRKKKWNLTLNNTTRHFWRPILVYNRNLGVMGV